jgi:4-amino-4-deoxy-L-arabinose transferase-like glycosyltransferase
LIAASTAGMIGYARAASMDMALTATFAAGMLAWWAWRESQKRIYLALFYLFMALGTLAKGPVAPILAVVIIVLFATATHEWQLVVRTLWFPGVLLFVVVALPWYVAVQAGNPQFFREFILEHNLARFSTDLYHHRQPFWYYLPVVLLALMPWTVFVIAAFAQTLRVWWNERKSSSAPDFELQFNTFACCWLIVPLIFFSLSQSKLPGYILPAVPAGAMLLANYLRLNFTEEKDHHVAKWMAVLHAFVAAAPIVPALLIAYLVTQHRPPAGRPIIFALAISFALCVAIALTLISRLGLRILRFVTLIPVLLTVAAVLKLGATALDQTLSARPLAMELASMEMHPLPLAVYGVPREMEYGLTFYRNRTTVRYEWGSVPTEEHLLAAPSTWKENVAKQTAGRRVSFLGHYAPQDVDYYWVSAASAKP